MKSCSQKSLFYQGCEKENLACDKNLFMPAYSRAAVERTAAINLLVVLCERRAWLVLFNTLVLFLSTSITLLQYRALHRTLQVRFSLNFWAICKHIKLKIHIEDFQFLYYDIIKAKINDLTTVLVTASSFKENKQICRLQVCLPFFGEFDFHWLPLQYCINENK